MLITPQQIEQNVYSENDSYSQRGTFPILREHFTNNLTWVIFCFALRQNILFLSAKYSTRVITLQNPNAWRGFFLNAQDSVCFRWDIGE